MYEYNCEVTRIVDGDTVDVIIDLGFDISYKSRVRLYGIDTPESRTRDKDEKVRGLMSKQYLVDELSKGQVVIKTYKDKKGKFGRVLGDFLIDGKQVSQIMCKEGHAVAYFGGAKADVQKQHMKNRKKLVEQGVVKGAIE